jgi:hypothetical protein
MHSVGAPDAERVHVLSRAPNQRRLVVGRPAHQDHPRLRELKAERCVEHVGGGEAVVHPAARLAHRACHDVHEGGHVMVGDLLPLLDLLDREGRAVADRGGVLLGHHALLCQYIHDGELHLKPGVELAPL